MWINFDKEQLQLLRSAMIVSMPAHPAAIAVVAKIDETFVEAEDPGGWADEARKKHGEDGSIEVDGDAVISMSDDGGAYVMAWVWVSDEDMGITDEEDDEDEE